MKKCWGMMLLVVGVGFLSLIGGRDAFADDSISLSVDTTNISLDIVPRTAMGEFVESDNATISVSTTSSSGYTLSIASSTGSTELVNTTDSTSKIFSISSDLTSADFSSSSNTQYNNRWGYKPSQYITTNGDAIIVHSNTGSNAVFKPLPSQAGEILAVTDQANQSNVPDNYTVSIGARANSGTAVGTYQSDSFVIMAVSNKSIVECDDTKLCVQFDGNGLIFPEIDTQLERTVNNVNYNSDTTQQQITRYSHTPNVSDAGEASGEYAINLGIIDSVTFSGATSLNVTIYYDAESVSFDWVSVYQSPFDISNTNDATVSTTTGNLSGKLSGINSGRTATYSSWHTQSYTVAGDTVKFHFRSDGSQNYYGYYAIITGVETVRDRTAISGEYVVPMGTNPVFYGWSTVQTTPGDGLPSEVEYTDEIDVKANLPGNNGEIKTLYAVWQQGQEVTFTKDSNVTSIEVLNNDGALAGIITASGQSLVLAQGSTYTIKPVHTQGYVTNAIDLVSGPGTISGYGFTVGDGSATIDITSKLYVQSSCSISPMISTVASGITYMQDINSSNKASVLANLAIGATYQIKDSRDGTTYCVGKLADGNLWLLDNLALDLTNSAVLNGMNQNNTNASNTTLGYFRNGGGNVSDKYAIGGVASWGDTPTYALSASYSVPLFDLTNKHIVPTDATIITGDYKVGGYYNYCAASAGSYCFGNGAAEQGTSTGDATEDICPKGWRMPTGGTSGEYQALYNNSNYNIYANYRSALHLPLSGYYYCGTAYEQGARGGFWASTRYSNYGMSMLGPNTNDVVPASVGNRNYGYSVRCLVQ